MKKRNIALLLVLILSLVFVSACSSDDASDETEPATIAEDAVDETEETEDEAQGEETESDEEPVTMLVAAAASMEYSLNEVIEMFEDEYPWITVEATYDSSGKLQTQIEEGLEADVFLSAATTQMDALDEQGLIEPDSITELLENKVVLIVPTEGESAVTGFDDILNAETIAIGDPESVLVGQYSEMIFNNMGIFDDVLAKASLGTNVTQVLNWVAEGSADAGVVYATDAATIDTVKVLEEAPEESLDTKVIYPIGAVAASENKDEASMFIEFVQTDEAIAVFEEFGFSSAQ